MWKAIIMRLLGLRPMWEVRVVSPTTGKNITGTRWGKATPSYRKALANFKKVKAKAKPDHWVKLQAVLVSRAYLRPTEAPTPPLDKEPVESEPVTIVTTPDDATVPPPLDQVRDTVQAGYSDNPPSAELHEAPDVPHGTADAIAHDCDFAGEMQLIDGAYRATCSVCGEPQ